MPVDQDLLDALDHFGASEAAPPPQQQPSEADHLISALQYFDTWEPTQAQIETGDKNLNSLSRPAQKFVAESSARARMEGAGPVLRNTLPIYDAAHGNIESLLARGANAVLP